LPEVQTRVWQVVFSGTKVATRVVVSPAMPENRPRERVRPEAMMGLTVTRQVAERFVPSVVVAGMVVLPTEYATILPCPSTVATEGLDEVQETVVTATVEGRMVAVSEAVCSG
jgi:hypothetical protein